KKRATILWRWRTEKFTHGSPHIRKRGAHTELRSDQSLLINQHWHHFAGKVADIVSNPYGVSWQNLVDSQRIMDITLNEFNTYPTAFICTNIQETDLAGHAEDVARYAERLQVVDRNLARLVEAMQPDDCLVVMADHGNDPTIGHSHHTREVVPVLVYQQGLVATQLGVRTTLSDVGATVCEFFRAPPPQNGRSFLSSFRFAGDTL
ncbi:phosphopentomutase, partial [Escherichia coli]|uniref:phosphopentomutase n=1 Tax=Escherichia coli TaxID=562 RepID=UPI002019A9D0